MFGKTREHNLDMYTDFMDLKVLDTVSDMNTDFMDLKVLDTVSDMNTDFLDLKQSFGH
ncbi:hypothetical protein BgiMline_029589, partial [Biomphalaria glabrata]